MGEPVTATEKPSSRPGFVRFETNRTFTGMGHEHYRSDQEILGDRPPNVVAARMIATGQVDEVHIYAQAITVKLFKDASPAGLKEIIEDLYTYYRPGVEVPTPESFTSDA